MKLFKKIRSHKVLNNISWILAGRISNMVLSFIVGVFSARYLGPSNYGLIGYAGAFATFFASICSLGINSIIIKELTDHKEKEGEILGTSIMLRLISSTFSFLSIQVIILFLNHDEPTTRAIVLLYNINLFFQAFEIIKYWFIKQLKSKYTEIVSIVAYIVTSIYKIFLLATNKSVEWFALSMSIDYIIIAGLLLFLYKKQGGQKLKFSKSVGKKLLKKSYHFILSGLMISIYNSTDKLMLQQIVDGKEVGLYTAAATISVLCTFIYSAIIESVNPIIVERHKNNDRTYNKANRQLYAIIFYLASFFAIIISLFSQLITSILYGEEYINATPSICILAWSVVFSYLGVARDCWIVCEKKQKYLKYIYLLSAIINIILNAFLIPVVGASGASIATLITQVATIFVFPAFFKEMRPNIKLIFEGISLRKTLDNQITSKVKSLLIHK